MKSKPNKKEPLSTIRHNSVSRSDPIKNIALALLAGIAWLSARPCCAETFTLSEADLMALDGNYLAHKLSPPSVVTVVAKRAVPGQGVEFDIWFPGNDFSTNTSILWCSSTNFGNGLLTGWDLKSYDNFALDFTLVSVNGSAGDGIGGPLIVGAAINQTNSGYAYNPESIGFPPYRPATQVVSTTHNTAETIVTVGFYARITDWALGNPWNPAGSLVTLLVKPAAGATPIPTPTVRLSLCLSNGVATASWLPKIPRAVLQMRDQLDAGSWVNSPSGSTNPVSIPLHSENRFYRMAQLPEPSEMVWISGSAFVMGNCMDANEGDTDERPLHTVYISGFYMDKFEVTTVLWDEVYQWATANGYNFSNVLGPGKAPNHPMQYVSWYDALKWCNARSEKEHRLPAYYTDAAMTRVYMEGQVVPYVRWNGGYRLPTEAEWERAARGGAGGHRFSWSQTDEITHTLANYYSSASYAYDTSPTRGFNPAFNDGVSPYTSPVGSFAPNGSGIYDMAGNVGEWCWDNYFSNWYSQPGASQNDPRGPFPLLTRVYRGGSAGSYAINCRTAERRDSDPTYKYRSVGFRTVLSPSQP